jgi:signal transduction histidine kinase/FixJ family two-component response regulator
MSQLRFNVKFIIWSGFGVVIALMLVLSSVMIYKLNEQTDQFENVVKVNNSKVALAHVMRDSIRLRSISLNKMALSDDIFFRDDEKINFDISANRFIRAFAKFKTFKLDQTELNLVTLAQEKTDIGYPLNQKASTMLLNDDAIEDIKPVLFDALQAQENNLIVLDKLIALQQSYAEESVVTAENNMKNIVTLLLSVISIAIIFSIIVSQTVSKIVSLKNDELAKATETKSLFLANMSHEIRTPLTAIIGFAKSQMIPNLPANHSAKATKIILRNSEHLLAVINDILYFSKIEAHKLEIEYTEFSIFKLLEDVQLSLQGLIGLKPLQFNINFNYPLPKMIRSDKTRLRQILINLGGNAIKFTDKGIINLAIYYDRNLNNMSFEVNDTGIGMTNEQQDKVFNTFSQADSTTTRRYGGTGLGLSISSELVRKLGGELTVTSELDVGSTFSFSILNNINDPNKSVQFINQAVKYDDEQHEIYDLVKQSRVEGTVLLVEGIPDNQALVSFYLVEMGASVTTVDNGQQAVDITENNKFDLVLMDMQMPVMGGLEAVTKIRERGDTCPIVMLTANAAKEFKEKSLQVGCDDFLTKPIDEEALLKVVASYLPVVELKEIQSNSIHQSQSINAVDNSNIIISSLIQKDSTRYNKFIKKFVNYLPTYVDEISKFIKVKDDIELKAITHKLKGVGGNMGFKILTEISSNFELAIQQGNREEIAHQFDELKNAANKIYRGNESESKIHHA